MDTIERKLDDYGIAFEKNVMLSEKTWIKTGGICKYWIMPTSIQQLSDTCILLWNAKIKFDIVGHTSNIFFHQSYSPQFIISTVKINCYTIEDETIICDCGVSVVKLAKGCLSKGYAGFYGLVGLPGTVAAAVYNNASCFGCSISSMLVSLDCLMSDGTIRTIKKEEMEYKHRSSVFKRKEVEGVILSVKLNSEKVVDITEEQKKSRETVLYRQDKQEKAYRNLGSVFASRKMRINVRNVLVVVLSRLLSFLGIVKDNRLFQKRMFLLLYGYRHLDSYISDRNINTFIWKDSNAERMFLYYKKFMACVYKDLVIEIEEKE